MGKTPKHPLCHCLAFGHLGRKKCLVSGQDIYLKGGFVRREIWQRDIRRVTAKRRFLQSSVQPSRECIGDLGITLPICKNGDNPVIGLWIFMRRNWYCPIPITTRVVKAEKRRKHLLCHCLAFGYLGLQMFGQQTGHVSQRRIHAKRLRLFPITTTARGEKENDTYHRYPCHEVFLIFLLKLSSPYKSNRLYWSCVNRSPFGTIDIAQTY